MISPLKEQYFLNYNIENIATDLIQSEVHLRRLGEGPIQGGHANCVVKHALHAAGECNEATSHALIADSGEKSQRFKVLSDNIRSFRKRVQKGNFDRDEAIRQVRALRNEFESFNPDFDVSKCESCGTVEAFVEQVESLEKPMKEKVLNSSPNNRVNSDRNMSNVAVVYGANFAGKLVDEALIPALPAEADLPITLGLAIGLPVVAKLMKLGDVAGTGLCVLGAYESTKLWDIAEGYMGSQTAGMKVTATQVTAQRTATSQAAQKTTALSKYVVT
jgi:hypothetical protein